MATSLGELLIGFDIDTKKADEKLESFFKKVEESKDRLKIKVDVDKTYLKKSIKEALGTDSFTIKLDARGNLKDSFDIRSLNNYQKALGIINDKINALNVIKESGTNSRFLEDEIAKAKEYKTAIENAISACHGLTNAGDSIRMLEEVNRFSRRTGKEKTYRAEDKNEEKRLNKIISLKTLIKTLEDEMSRLSKSEFKAPELKGDIDAQKAKITQLINQAKEYLEAIDSVNSSKIKELKADSISRITESRGIAGNADLSINKLKDYNEQWDKTSQSIANAHEALRQIFGFAAIKQFATSLIEIGGEFEKQQIALRSMLGDLGQAETLFSQIKSLAIKSPFEFKELASYAKQMAAYGIPYEELYDSTKRLADISAGLGVDMQRIILAYGQVRSATVLKGTELRQFTEAGIPLVQSLADKISQMNGNIVTTGEVFDMISKKQIPFEYVKDVLYDMTNEGGKFYNMQAELAETVAGKWSNLRDAYDIMLSEIEKGNNGALGASIDGIRSLMENWRAVLPFFTGIGSSYLMLTSVVKAYNLVESGRNVITMLNNKADIIKQANIIRQTVATTALNAEQTKLLATSRALSMVNPWTIGLVAIAGIGAALYTAISNLKTLHGELDEIRESVDKDTSSELYNLEAIKERLKDVAEGTDERKNLINELNSKYGSYLSNLAQESDSYEKLAENIDAARNALIEKAKADMYDRQASKVKEYYDEDMANQEDILGKYIAGDFARATGKAISSKLKEQIVFAIKNAVMSGATENELLEMLQKRYSKLGFGAVGGQYKLVEKKTDDGRTVKVPENIGGSLLQIRQMIRSANELNNELKELDDTSRTMFEGAAWQPYSIAINDIKEKHEKIRASIEGENAAREKAKDQIKEYEEILNTLKSYNQERTSTYSSYFSKYTELKNSEDFKDSLGKKIESIAKDSPLTLYVNQSSTLDEFVSKAKAAYKEAEKTLKEYGSLLVKLGIKYDPSMTGEEFDKLIDDVKNSGLGNKIPFYERQSVIDALKASKEKTAIQNAEKEFGFSLHDDGKNKNNSTKDVEAEKWRNRLSLLKTFYTEYQKLLSLYGKEAAKQKIMADASFDELKEFGVTDPEKQIENLNLLISKLGNTEQQKKVKASAIKQRYDVEVEIDKEKLEAAKKKLEEDFSELTSKYDVFKQWKEATGDVTLSMNIAFGGIVKNDTIADEIRERIEKEIEKVKGNGYSSEITFDMVLNMNEDKLKSIFGDSSVSMVQQWSKAYRDEMKKISKESTDALLKVINDSKSLNDRLRKLENDARNASNKIWNTKPVSKEVNAELAKRDSQISANLDLERYKLSAEYVNLFNNALALSSGEIEKASKNMESKLNAALKNGVITAEEFNAEMEKLRKVSENFGKNGLFGKQNDLSIFLKGGLEGLRDKIADQIESINIKIEERRSKGQLTTDLDIQKENLEQQYKKIQDLIEKTSKFSDGVAVATGIINGLSESCKSLSDMFDALGNEHMANFFDDMNDIIGIFSSILSPVDSIVQNAMKGNVSGIISSVISAPIKMVTAPITGLAKLHDKRLQREIEASERRQKELELASKRINAILDRTLGGVYNFKDGSGKTYYEEQYKNLTDQREEVWKQYAAEDKKKKSDKDKIADYRNAIEELDEQIRYFALDMANELYGIDFMSWADDLADAVVSAWASGEDAAEAWKDKVSDIMKDVVKNVIATKYIQQALEAPMNEFIKSFDAKKGILDEDLIASTAKGVVDAYGVAGETSMQMLDALKSAGLDLSDKNTKSKSGLSAGITSITENTADLLASYLNDVRLNVSVLRALQEKYYASLEGDNGMNAIAQSQLTELRSIAQNTQSIYSLFNQITNGTKKVYVN